MSNINHVDSPLRSDSHELTAILSHNFIYTIILIINRYFHSTLHLNNSRVSNILFTWYQIIFYFQISYLQNNELVVRELEAKSQGKTL